MSASEALQFGQDAGFNSSMRSGDLFVNDGTMHHMREREITTDSVISFMNNVNALSAAHSWQQIQEGHANGPLDEETVNRFKVEIDSGAKQEIEQALHGAPFISEIVGCEGGKEKVKYGEEAEVPLLSGHYGLGHVIPFESRDELINMEGHDFVRVVIDPIEQTTDGAKNRPGAYTVGAGIRNGKIDRIPKDSDAMYLDRIIGPARLRRLGSSGLSMDATVDHNVRSVMRAYRLSNPGDVEAVVLDRPRNGQLIEDLQRMGVTVRFVKRGDLAPALAALASDRPLISMGAGGKEEGMIGALAAFATSGFFEGRYTDIDGNPAPKRPETLRLSSLIVGNKSDAFLSMASITGIQSRDSRTGEKINLGAFEMPGVQKVSRGKTANPGFNIAGGYINGMDGSFRRIVTPLN